MRRLLAVVTGSLGGQGMDDDMVLTIEARISQRNMGGVLHVREEITINSLGFLEMSQILGQFHELAKQIERERPLRDRK